MITTTDISPFAETIGGGFFLGLITAQTKMLTGEEHAMNTCSLVHVQLRVNSWTEIEYKTKGKLLGIWELRVILIIQYPLCPACKIDKLLSAVMLVKVNSIDTIENKVKVR